MTTTNPLRWLCKAEHTLDSFERAIYALAPAHAHCGVRIVGHAVEKDGASRG